MPLPSSSASSRSFIIASTASAPVSASKARLSTGLHVCGVSSLNMASARVHRLMALHGGGFKGRVRLASSSPQPVATAFTATNPSLAINRSAPVNAFTTTAASMTSSPSSSSSSTTSLYRSFASSSIPTVLLRRSGRPYTPPPSWSQPQDANDRQQITIQSQGTNPNDTGLLARNTSTQTRAATASPSSGAPQEAGRGAVREGGAGGGGGQARAPGGQDAMAMDQAAIDEHRKQSDRRAAAMSAQAFEQQALHPDRQLGKVKAQATPTPNDDKESKLNKSAPASSSQQQQQPMARSSNEGDTPSTASTDSKPSQPQPQPMPAHSDASRNHTAASVAAAQSQPQSQSQSGSQSQGKSVDASGRASQSEPPRVSLSPTDRQRPDGDE